METIYTNGDTSTAILTGHRLHAHMASLQVVKVVMRDVEPREAGRDLAVLLPPLHRPYEVRSVGLFSTPMASAA